MRQWTLQGDRAQSHITRMISREIKLFMLIRASMFEAQISLWKSFLNGDVPMISGTALKVCGRRTKTRLSCLEVEAAGEACDLLMVMNRVEGPRSQWHVLTVSVLTLWVLVLSGPLNVRCSRCFKLQWNLCWLKALFAACVCGWTDAMFNVYKSVMV